MHKHNMYKWPGFPYLQINFHKFIQDDTRRSLHEAMQQAKVKDEVKSC